MLKKKIKPVIGGIWHGIEKALDICSREISFFYINTQTMNNSYVF